MAPKWNMERKYIIRRRWAVVIALLILVMALMAFYYVSTHIYWVDWNEGYCFGSIEECFPEYFGGNK